jgi:molybdopterin synthase catalytic subunit
MGQVEVRVLLFAGVRERLGRSEARVLLDDAQATVGALKAALTAAHPALAGLWHALRVAVNCELVGDDAPISAADEVALIPPVAGGADAPSVDVTHWLRDAPLDEAEVQGRVTHGGAGAVVTFVGAVRDHARGRAVEWLEYEVYPEMAVKKLREVEAAVEAAHPGVRCAVCHRYGRLVVGDVAVVVAVSAPHRVEAFAACAAGIDLIKAMVPIWKREVGPDGSEWVGMGS